MVRRPADVDADQRCPGHVEPARNRLLAERGPAESECVNTTTTQEAVMNAKPQAVHVDKLTWTRSEWADEGVVALTALALTALAQGYVLEVERSPEDAREWKASVQTPHGELQSLVIARSENGAKRACGTIVNAAIRADAKAARQAEQADAASKAEAAPKPKRTRKPKAEPAEAAA
jgi:hypothetical protein